MGLKCNGEMREYVVIGRKKPTEKDTAPPLFKMRIFAPNDVVAKSRFWYYVKMMKKEQKTRGEIVSDQEVFEKRPACVKNYGVWLRYDSRSGSHNMYREYRDVTVASAITQCYRDMGARHRVTADRLQILKVQEIRAKDCKRTGVTQYHDSKITFPLPHRITKRKGVSRFTTARPRTHFQ